MISFIITTLRLVQATWHGIRRDSVFRSLLVLFVATLVGGTMFYSRTEGWSVLDSLYFCVMTMSTIGFGDYAPTGGLSKIFTMIYSIVSIGVFAAVVSKIVSYILENHKKLTERMHRSRPKEKRQSRESRPGDGGAGE